MSEKTGLSHKASCGVRVPIFARFEALNSISHPTGRARIRRCAIALKPATILGFQRLLVKRKYKELFSPKRRGRPGPKDPSAELIAAVVEM